MSNLEWRFTKARLCPLILLSVLNLKSIFVYPSHHRHLKYFKDVYASPPRIKKKLIHTHSYIRTFVHSCVRAFVRSCVRAFVRSCVRAFVRSCVRAFVCSYVRTFVRSYVRAFVRSCVRTFMRSCVRAFTQSCVCTFRRPLTLYYETRHGLTYKMFYFQRTYDVNIHVSLIMIYKSYTSMS